MNGTQEFCTVNTEMFAEFLRNMHKKHTKMIPRTSILTAVKKLTYKLWLISVESPPSLVFH